MGLEAQGLVTVAAGIFSGFNQAIETITLLQSALDPKNTDDSQLAVEYQILMTRLQAWGRFCGIDGTMNKEPSAPFLSKPEYIRELIIYVFHQIEKLKETGNAKVEKHKLILPTAPEGSRNDSDNRSLGGRLRLKQRLLEVVARVNWVKTEKNEFESIISKLEKLITSLEDFIPECKLPFDALIASVLAKVSDKTQLEALSDPKSRSRWALALSARAKAIGQNNKGKASHRTAQQLTFASESPDFGTLRLQEKDEEEVLASVWVEWNIIDAGSRSEEYVTQIESLTYLFERVSEPALCLPPCLGIFEDKQYEIRNRSAQRRIGLIFGVPKADILDNGGQTGPEYDGDLISHRPRTLASLILDKNFPIPALGDRFRLAFVLATTISYFHAAKWLHKGLTSESLLFFHEMQSQKVNSSNPFITGFQFSRQQHGESQSYSPLEKKQFMHYYHPDADKGFNKQRDLYGLGVILCEIGSWMSVEARGKKSKHKENLVDRKAWNKFIVDNVLEDLAWRMGKEYQSAVKTLLTGNLREENGDEYFAQQYLEKVIRPLSRCMA